MNMKTIKWYTGVHVLKNKEISVLRIKLNQLKTLFM